MRKNDSLNTLHKRSSPLTLLLTAIDDSTTIRMTANKSSTISTASTWGVNRRWLMFKSLSAFMMMVVDDIDSIAPRKRLLMLVKSEVRTHEKTGKNVAQHNGLLQPLEQHGGNARHHENQTEVGNHARFAV